MRRPSRREALASGAAVVSALTLCGLSVLAPDRHPAPEPTPTVTVTAHLAPKPAPTVTVTETKKPKPRPTVTVTRKVYVDRSKERKPVTSSGGPKSLARAALAERGEAGEWPCLDALWEHESGWDPNAQNPSSTAYGIAQFLDSTWATVGATKTSDPARQIDAGLDYVDQTYGGPCGAWSAWQVKGWY